jgi:TonB-linked SusC/RagA family outer membrane protein
MQITLLKLLYFMSRQCLIALVIQSVTFHFLIAAGTRAQGLNDTRISLEARNETLSDIFKVIEAKTDFVFVYPEAIEKKSDVFSVKFSDESLEKILQTLGREANFKFKNIDYTITIALDESSAALGRPLNVKGTVTMLEDGSSMPGVNVVIKGTVVGTTTDQNGAYSIDVPDGNATLVFSFIGFLQQEINVAGRSVVDVVMETDISTLSEVVVVAYGEQSRESVVGAVTTVKMRDLKTAAPRSLNNALAGKVAGVISVQRSGEPGYDDAQFWVRGISTFGSGGSNPLIIVDGVERPINNIEPEEIETFSVLKDASATAVYGIRGANGVILVTTRRGGKEKPVISFKMERGITAPTRLPEFVDAPTYLTLYNEARLASNPSYVTQYTPDVIEKYRSGEDPYLYPNVDWLDLMLKKTSSNQRANLNVSGGGEIARYFVSATYYKEDGLWKGDNLNSYNTNAGLKRYNFRANTDVNLRKDTELSLGIGGILVTSNYPGAPAGAIWFGGPTGNPETAGGIMYNTPVGYSPTYPDPDGEGIVYGGLNGVDNPYELLTGRGFATEWRNNIQSDITLRHDLSRFVKGLKVDAMFAFDAYNRHFIQRGRTSPRYIATGRDPVTNELQLNRWIEGQPDLGFSKQSDGNRRIYTQTKIVYDRTFGDHTVGGLLLYNQQDYQDAAAGDAISALPFRYQGFVGRLNYDYKNKYFLEFSSGYNGSENFEKGKRFGYFPAIAAGWIVSEEPFFSENVSFIEYLKFRGSYGYKGNDRIGGRRFAYLTTVGGGGGGGYGLGFDNNNWIGTRFEDQWGADLTWEVESELNVGIEVRLLQGLYIQADIFRRHRKDIFLQRNSLPSIMGLQNNPWGNLGEFENNGFDATLEYRTAVGDLGVAVRGNYTFARNRLINMDQPDWQYTYQNREGKRLNQPFGLIAEGLFVDEADIASSATQSYGPVRPGDIKYKDVNGDGTVNSFDEVAIGDPDVPEIVYGFGTTLSYKGFDLSLFFQGAANMDFMLGGIGFFPFTESGFRGSVTKNALDRWTPENPRQDALFPRLSYGQGYNPRDPKSAPNNFLPSTWWQRSADYLRLKTVEFGYTVPKKVSQKLKISTLRFYVSGFNLLTWSKFDFWDPELGNGNGANYPIMRNANVGVNINF